MSPRVKTLVNRLNEISDFARLKYAHNAGVYMSVIYNDYLKYWRELQKEYSVKLHEPEWNELYFFFNEQLYEESKCKFDMYWLIYELDNQPLFPEGHKIEPFWKNHNRRI